MIREIILVGGGGALGSVLRYLLSYGWLSGTTLMGFPLGTFTVNIVGSLLIGIFLEVIDSTTALWLLVVGFCGGFTTFSSFSGEVVRLLREASYAPAALYMLLSVGVCVCATLLGCWIGTFIKN